MVGAGVLRDVGEHRRRVVVAGPVQALAAGEQPRAAARSSPAPARRGRSRPLPCDIGPRSVSSAIGSPTVSASIFSTRRRVNSSAICSWTMKRLALMQLWPLLSIRRGHGGVDGGVEVGRGHDDERVAAAELEHAGLDVLPGAGADLAAGGLAAGEGDGAHAVVVDHAPRSPRADQQRLEHALGKPARASTSSIAIATCGTFEACLSSPVLPAMSAGHGKRKHLPVGEVPRHDRQDRAQRLVAGEDAGVLRTRRSGFGHSSSARSLGGVVGVPAAAEGALGHLGLRRDEGLAHLQGRELGEAARSRRRRCRRRRAASRSAARTSCRGRSGTCPRTAGASPRAAARVRASNSRTVSPVAGFVVAMAMCPVYPFGLRHTPPAHSVSGEPGKTRARCRRARRR